MLAVYLDFFTPFSDLKIARQTKKKEKAN